MKLVSEIDEVCDQNDIPYSLEGRTAGCAVEYGKFTTKCYQFRIMVLAKDIPLLRKKLLQKNRTCRAVEDMVTNPNLAFNQIRYVDTGTTIIDKREPVKYKYYGVAVTVIPLFTRPISKETQILETGINYLNGGKVASFYNIDSIQNERDRKVLERTKRCIRMTQHAVKVFGRQKVANRIFRSILNEKDRKVEDQLTFRLEDTDEKFWISASMFENRIRVPFEGMNLPVPEDHEEYFELLYKKSHGKKWKAFSREPLLSETSIHVICDPYHSYEENRKTYAENGIDIDDLFGKEQELKMFLANEHAEWEMKSKQTLFNGKRSFDRINLFVEYSGQMESLREAASQNDVERIKEIMNKYFSCVRKYLKYDMGFYINEELHQLACLVWEAEGKDDYGEKIMQLVPRYYINEDLGEYLERYK